MGSCLDWVKDSDKGGGSSSITICRKSVLRSKAGRCPLTHSGLCRIHRPPTGGICGRVLRVPAFRRNSCRWGQVREVGHAATVPIEEKLEPASEFPQAFRAVTRRLAETGRKNDQRLQPQFRAQRRTAQKCRRYRDRVGSSRLFELDRYVGITLADGWPIRR